MEILQLPANKYIFQQVAELNGMFLPPDQTPGWFLVAWDSRFALWGKEGKWMAAEGAPMPAPPPGNVTSIVRPPLPPHPIYGGQEKKKEE